ncbi:MAG TPA: type II and III secretion system protein family protein [Alphaproteobacteria bacterium]|nr:type II and III secretion system protein family protein [Alphaproteobacteria bacterium]HOO49760.1 type II and III secretion system protein family protein [Alphaproteobacteria bacterium]
MAALFIGLVMASFAVPVESAPREVLKLTIGKAEIVEIPNAVADIMVADPKIADVSVLQSNKLYVVGANLGDTNVIVLDDKGNVVSKIDVSVSIDTKSIEAMVSEIFPMEKDVQVRMIGDQAILTGSVSTPTMAQKISRLVAAHMGEVQEMSGNVDEIVQNLLTVRGEQQVMLRVRMLEVSRDILKEFGMETSNDRSNFGDSARLRSTTTVNTQTGLTEDPFGVTSLLFNTAGSGLGEIQLLLNALERDNLANVLAEPNLTSVSGEQAGFLAGGEFPVPVGRDRDGNIVIEYKQFGVSLNFKPTVLSEDRISLQLNTEVSSLDPGQGITLSDIQIPGLDIRKASTTVEINSGGSLMMAGLLKSENIKGMSGLPGVKDTPVIGDLISSKSFERQETELVVIVTPYLVQPYADETQAKPVFESTKKLPPPPPTAAMSPGDKGKTVPLYTQAEAVAITDVEAEELPKIVNSPMSNVFSRNMRKIYGERVRNIPADDQAFGYMLD